MTTGDSSGTPLVSVRNSVSTSAFQAAYHHRRVSNAQPLSSKRLNEMEILLLKRINARVLRETLNSFADQFFIDAQKAPVSPLKRINVIR